MSEKSGYFFADKSIALEFHDVLKMITKDSASVMLNKPMIISFGLFFHKENMVWIKIILPLTS